MTQCERPRHIDDGYEWVTCEECGGDGLNGHDCGEDPCPCLLPDDNVDCTLCDGDGGWWQEYPFPSTT